MNCGFGYIKSLILALLVDPLASALRISPFVSEPFSTPLSTIKSTSVPSTSNIAKASDIGLSISRRILLNCSILQDPFKDANGGLNVKNILRVNFKRPKFRIRVQIVQKP